MVEGAQGERDAESEPEAGYIDNDDDDEILSAVFAHEAAAEEDSELVRRLLEGQCGEIWAAILPIPTRSLDRGEVRRRVCVRTMRDGRRCKGGWFWTSGCTASV